MSCSEPLKSENLARLNNMENLACLIVARNLGDAVIQSEFLRKLEVSGYARQYVVWARPQVAFLFEDIPNCEVICSQFPVGTTKDFGRKNAWKFFVAAWRVRRLRPSVSLDLIGDFRERFFARLVGALRHLHIGWQAGHPFAQIIRNPFGRGRPAIEVPAKIPNVYQSYGLFLSHLTGGKQDSLLSHVKSLPDGKLKIGLHPFASKRCRMWPEQNWLAVAEQLVRDGHEITLFGAASERATLERMFNPILSQVSVYTKSLADFTQKVAELDLFVGLDSFGVHMGQRQGVKSVLINAGSDPSMWPPPNAALLAHSGGCAHYPCNNVTKCDGTEDEFICIRSVAPDEVLSIANGRG